MNSTRLSPLVLVKLRESTVAVLMARRLGDETIDAVTARLACYRSPDDETLALTQRPQEAPPEDSVLAPRANHHSRNYILEILGETLSASTLAELFGAFIDRLAELDPGAIERLAATRSRKRAYVSRDKAQIHPGRPDLPVRRASSGWWISSNIGTADLVRALRATCATSDLIYGLDISFLGTPS